MLISCFISLARQTTSIYHRYKNCVALSAPIKILHDIYHLPWSSIDIFLAHLAQREKEETKYCEVCQGREEVIKKSDIMCKHCKLEISLGRQVR